MNIPKDTPLTEVHHAEFNEVTGWRDAAFKIAYAVGFILIGWFIDRIGTRKGFASAMSLWGVAAIGTGVVGSIVGLLSLRFLLGFGEDGNFPHRKSLLLGKSV